MLNSISWDQFLTTVIVVVGGYYVIATLLLFGDEIKSFFNKRSSTRIDDERVETPAKVNRSKTFIGAARPAAAVTSRTEETVDAQFVIAGSEPAADDDPIDIVTQASILAKAANDLCTEVTSLLTELKPTSFEEMELAMKPLLTRYVFLLHSPHRQQIYEFIIRKLHETTRLQLTELEVDGLWNTSGE